jgi:hypothetical protein
LWRGAIVRIGNLADFGAYRKALELFDLVVEDTARFMNTGVW